MAASTRSGRGLRMAAVLWAVVFVAPLGAQTGAPSSAPEAGPPADSLPADSGRARPPRPWLLLSVGAAHWTSGGGVSGSTPARMVVAARVSVPLSRYLRVEPGLVRVVAGDAGDASLTLVEGQLQLPFTLAPKVGMLLGAGVAKASGPGSGSLAYSAAAAVDVRLLPRVLARGEVRGYFLGAGAAQRHLSLGLGYRL